MKQFLITYRLTNATAEDWQRDIAKFIAALDSDPDLKGKISYRCLKSRNDNSYYHLATAADDQAIAALQQRDFFKHYNERTRQVAGGAVTVSPLEIVAETVAKV